MGASPPTRAGVSHCPGTYLWVVVAASLALPSVVRAAGACGPQPSDLADIQIVASWIGGLQYSNPSLPSFGAIKVHHGVGLYSPQGTPYFRVAPYNSNLAVLGLLRSPVKEKLTVTENWIRWYLGHLNLQASPPGVVFDHWYLADGSGETTCPPGISPAGCNYDDSAPSYAASLLGIAWAYYEAGGSAAFLSAPGHKQKFETIAGVILSLQHPDGLTAEINSPVKYLMDNSEVYAGLKGMERLESRVFGDNAAAQKYAAAAQKARNTIRNEMVNPATSLYRVAKFLDGTYWEADLNVWYPGSVALAWPHLFGVTEGQSRTTQTQMAALNGSWDGSPNPEWTTNLVEPHGFLWPSIGHAALLAGDCSRARTYANFIKALKFPTSPADIGFPWPFAVDDGGWLINTLSKLSGK